MQKINSGNELKEAIIRLEVLQASEGKMLKEQFHLAYQSIMPINIIKNTFKAATESHELKNDIINTAIGITTGFLSKKLFESVSHSPVKKLLGTALLFGITSVVTNNPEPIKSLGKGLLKTIVCKIEDLVHGAEDN